MMMMILVAFCLMIFTRECIGLVDRVTYLRVVAAVKSLYALTALCWFMTVAFVLSVHFNAVVNCEIEWFQNVSAFVDVRPK